MKIKLVILMMLAAAAFAQDAVSPKGIYVDPGSSATKNGAAYRVMLLRGDARQEVPVSFPFRSGDRFKLQLNLKNSAYVYVLNRTFNGDPKELGEKGIQVVRDEDHKRRDHDQSTFTLLYPGPGGLEKPEMISAGKFIDVPGDASLRMDKTPGLEKLYVVISDQPLDLQKMFSNGQLRLARTTRGANGSESQQADAKHSDSSNDVLDRLDKELADWAADSKTQVAPAGTESKGIKVEPDSYTVGARNKPILAEITLRHFRD